MRAEELIIFSDMDGTMLTDWSLGPKVPEANLEAMKSFISAGGLFSIASGRQFSETERFFEGIKFPVPMVLGNGTVIYDAEKGEVISKVALADEIKRDCLEYVQNNEGLWLVAGDEFGIYQVMIKGSEWETKLTDLVRTPLTVQEFLDRDLVKVCYVIENPQNVSKVAADTAAFKSAELFQMMQSSPVFLEVLDKRAGKANGIKEAIKFAKAENRTIICIGDYDNDCDMLELADVAACPSNASPNVLRMADIVTCDNNKGAIADLINKLGLN